MPRAPGAAPLDMQDTINYQELARRYGLAPPPESVSRLTLLVARQDSDLDEIARVIAQDPALRARLLRVAHPDAAHEAEHIVETVQDALMRNGVGCALLLAMSTPLALALAKTFQMMLSLKLESLDLGAAPPLDPGHVLGTIDFSGKTTGRVCLRLSAASARLVAAGILGLDSGQALDDSEVNDAVGELLNIITGNFKSNLCDAGLDCRLTTPQVTRAQQLATRHVPGGGLERMAFRTGQIVVFVEVTVNPWSDD